MSENEPRTKRTARRALLGGAAASAAGVAGGFTLTAGGSAVADQDVEQQPGARRADGPQEVRGSFTFADRRGRQRFLMSARKPPIIIDGEVLPPEERGGPDRATYLILNDGQGNEKGGIVGHDTGASVSLDYPTSQGATLYTESRTRDDTGEPEGIAALSLAGMAPKVGEAGVERALLSGGNGGAALQLNDSKGRPRILIGLDAEDAPMIKVLDAAGEVVADLLSGAAR